MSSTTSISGKSIVLYFNVHQPFRLRKVGFLDIGEEMGYFNDHLNGTILQRIARTCYLPVNEMLRRLCEQNDNVRLTFSISGPAIKQFVKYAPEVLESFQALVATGKVELLGETSHHSLACLMPNDEFTEQVRDHSNMMLHYFGFQPAVFRNTELIYSNSIGSRVAKLGFKGVICDDVDRVLEGKQRTGVYRHPVEKNLKVLTRQNDISDDIGFRFTDPHGLLDLKKYLKKIEHTEGVVTLGFDYETFGEHKSSSTGIIDFLRDLILNVTSSNTMKMATPSEVFQEINPTETFDCPDFISWADRDKDLSAWLENEIQNEAFLFLQNLEEQVRSQSNANLLDTWRNLQTSDHLYYMSTKTHGDGEVHSYFSPYNSPYEAYINYMNILTDFQHKIQHAPTHESIESAEYERRHEPVPVWAERAQANYHELTSR